MQKQKSKSTNQKIVHILLSSFAIKIQLTFFAAYAAFKFIPFLGFFPYRGILEQYRLPPMLSSFANFDGVHYLLIAQRGYAQYEQAFFPLYPLLVRIVGIITGGNLLIAALLISNVSFFIGLWLFFKLLYHELRLNNAWWSIVLLLAFPTSFFFHAVYTEGFFFMLFAGALYFLKRHQFLRAGVCALLSSLTRFVGVFLVIPFIFELVPLFSQKKRAYLHAASWLLFPFVGLLAYMLYLWKTTGDPLFFFNAQPAFGANRSTAIVLLPQVYYRYIRIFLTAKVNFAYIIAVFELTVFTLMFALSLLDGIKRWRNKELFLFGIALFSLANVTLPTLTGTFSSVPRYALFSVSAFIFLSQQRSVVLKGGIVVFFAVLQAVLLGFFLQGYFVS